MLDYILDFRHQTEYNLPPEKLKELQDMNARCQVEMDIIAKAASYAINHAADAMEPVTYAITKLNIPNFELAFFEIPPNVNGFKEPPKKADLSAGTLFCTFLTMKGPAEDTGNIMRDSTAPVVNTKLSKLLSDARITPTVPNSALI